MHKQSQHENDIYWKVYSVENLNMKNYTQHNMEIRDKPASDLSEGHGDFVSVCCPILNF